MSPRRRSFVVALVIGLLVSLAPSPALGSPPGPSFSSPAGALFTEADASARTAGATFSVTWLDGCDTPPPEAIAALDYASELWGAWISSTVPIEVTACWAASLSCSGDALACGGPTYWSSDFANAPLVGVHYPAALANALSGTDLDPSRPDINLHFLSAISWSFATTTPPTSGRDFVAVALHELAHGLGFVSNMYEDYTVGFCGGGLYGALYPCPTAYDWFTVDSSGVGLLTYLTPDPRDLGDRLKADANFGGPNAVVANAGSIVKLYTPALFTFGTSLSHLDENTFYLGENKLMTPSYSGTTRHPGPVTLAMMQDIGWLRSDGAPNVVVTGPAAVGAGNDQTFTGTFMSSKQSGQTITYTWTADDHAPLVRTSTASTDPVTFNWTTAGEKTIVLTVSAPANGGLTHTSATRSVLVGPAPLSERVYLPFLTRNP